VVKSLTLALNVGHLIYFFREYNGVLNLCDEGFGTVIDGLRVRLSGTDLDWLGLIFQLPCQLLYLLSQDRLKEIMIILLSVSFVNGNRGQFMRSGSFLLSARSTSDLLSVLDSLLLVGKYGASLGDTTDVSVVP